MSVATVKTGTCGHPQCPGGHGWSKHDNCLSAALWEAGPDYADEHGGNSTDWHGYMMLFTFDEQFTIPAYAWSEGFDLIVAVGTYVTLTERSSGAVNFQAYESAADARKAWEEFDHEYCLWDSVDEEIMSHGFVESSRFVNRSNPACWAVEWAAGDNGNMFQLINPIGTGDLIFSVSNPGDGRSWMSTPVIDPSRFGVTGPVESYAAFLVIATEYVGEGGGNG